jgi:hypothetical protein
MMIMIKSIKSRPFSAESPFLALQNGDSAARPKRKPEPALVSPFVSSRPSREGDERGSLFGFDNWARSLSFSLIFLFISCCVNAQNDTSVFTKQKKVETSDYVFLVPGAWKNIPEIDISSKNRKFDFSGVGIPPEYRHEPVTATCNLRKYECKSIRTAEDYITSEITSYPDRVTPPGHNYDTESLTILSGEKATLYSSRYLRRNKKSNFSRFDLIVYSEKRKAAYMFTIAFQYRDPTYAFDTDNKLKQYAVQFFKNILLR